MKKNLFTIIGILFLFCFSCKKDNESETNNIIDTDTTKNQVDTTSIVSAPICHAGITDTLMNFTDYIPDNYPANHFYMNIDAHGGSDLDFWIGSISGISGHTFDSGIFLLDTTFQICATPDLVSPLILNYQDTIDDQLNWSKINDQGSNLFKLAKDYINYPTSSSYNYAYWYHINAYVGVRKRISTNTYKYGWIKINVEDYAVVAVQEFAFAK